MPYDLLLKNATLIDPAQSIHDRRDIAFTNGKVAAIAEKNPDTAAQVIDCRGSYVAPGMIETGEFPFMDSRGQTRTGNRRMVPTHVIRAGRIYDPNSTSHHHPHHHHAPGHSR